MVAEGELRSNLDDSDKVRELQDKMGEMKSEVRLYFGWYMYTVKLTITANLTTCCFASLKNTSVTKFNYKCGNINNRLLMCLIKTNVINN